MHRFFLIVSIILVVLTFISTGKAGAFAPSPRYLMVLITIAWLFIWGGAAIFKKILPISSGVGVISFFAGVALFGCLIWGYNKLDKRKSEKRIAAIEAFYKKQINRYKQEDLIKKFVVVPNRDSADSINSISIEITFKNDSLITDYDVSLLAFVHENNENCLLYENTLFSESMSHFAESENEISYQLEVSYDKLKYELIKLKEKFGNEVSLDYSVYIESDNYIMGGRIKLGICLTSVSEEIIQNRDYLINGYPYVDTYPALSDSKLRLNTVLNLDQFNEAGGE